VNLPDMSFSPPPSGDDLGPHYLNRLARLVRLRRDLDDELNTLGADLIDRAIVSTVRDCIDHGAGEEAQVLVAELPGDN
jgi:hypothetical protein